MSISSLISQPAEYITSLLLSLPGIMLALCGHEAAHAYIAHKRGDDTAKLMGRMSLNPARHLDPMGFVCMLLVGLGWAKPVPVNPNNFRHRRRDDLLVSLAGIAANILMCIIAVLLMNLLYFIAFNRAAAGSVEGLSVLSYADSSYFLNTIVSSPVYVEGTTLYKLLTGIWVVDSNDITVLLITPALGTVAGYVYKMLISAAQLNICLAAFNLIPVPPLDGYHVLNDLILRRPLFAPAKAARIGSGILLALVLLGNINPNLNIISTALGYVVRGALGLLTSLGQSIITLLG